MEIKGYTGGFTRLQSTIDNEFGTFLGWGDEGEALVRWDSDPNGDDIEGTFNYRKA